jgi:ABC-type multidrug transport system fused ATPase/permease subunit
LNDVIGRLPEGLDTIVGERGYSLSGGERQRVGIARAICRNAPILLLDEATSALDSVTEQMVMERLMADRNGSADHTMIIVAHRTSTLKNADRIVYFEQGRIVEQRSRLREAVTIGSM